MSTSTPQLHENLGSQSSDEKMDTGSESLQITDHTPNSNHSWDYEDLDQELNTVNQSVLRLQTPEVLRLSEPGNDNIDTSLINNVNNLKISSPVVETRPKHLSLSRFNSTLISTTNHPLMGLGSPDENYPDLIPKKLKEDDKDLSLSSIEDDKNEANGFYSPQRNTSKNNLYFNDNYTTDNHINTNLDINSHPDVARGIDIRKSEKGQRISGRIAMENGGVNMLEVEQSPVQSMLKKNNEISEEEFHVGAVEWGESPAHVRTRPNFELPIELKTKIKANTELDSPDVVSSSQEERSAYQALLDPYTGSVALRPAQPRSPHQQRRKIHPPVEEEGSLDGGSVHSLEWEEEEPPRQPSPHHHTQPSPPHHSLRSPSPVSSCSEPIPSWSARDELLAERAALAVPRPGQPPATADMKVIEPYKRVVSHGGYDAAGCALIVFSACHLPDVRRADYHYVMDNLFLYVIWTLERLVVDSYVLVYLYGSAGPRRLPTLHWLREYYRLIDRRLRKSLKHLYIVHPTYGLKIFVAFTKAFVSSKFFKKVSYVRNLDELMSLIPVEPNAIPELVKQYDAARR